MYMATKDRPLGTLAVMICNYRKILTKKVTVKLKKSKSRSGEISYEVITIVSLKLYFWKR